MVLGCWKRRKSNKIIKPVTKPEIPTHFRCPITLDLMRDPVTLSTGITYDRDSIETWLESGNFTCPVTNQVLRNFDRIPNHVLRKMIQEWCTKNRGNGVQRIPTPRVPVGADEVAEISLAIEDSAKQLDKDRFMDLVALIQKWGAESERNRGCIAVNGAVRALAKAFNYFASVNNDNTNVCKEILSALSWMIPFRDDDTATCAQFFGSEPSLRCMVRFLRSDDVAKRNSAALLEEIMVIITREELIVENFAKIDGLSETLVELVRTRTCPKVTKCSLGLIRNLILCDNVDVIRSELLELGLVSLVLELLVESEQGMIVERGLGVIEALCGYENGRETVRENGLTIPVLAKKLLRVSNLATEFSVSAIWKLLLCHYKKNNSSEDREVVVLRSIVEALQVGAFQKLVVIIQVGCGYETKEKANELLKLLNPYRPGLECIESIDFKSLKRSF